MSDRRSVVSKVDHQQFRMRLLTTHCRLRHLHLFRQCLKLHPICYMDILRLFPPSPVVVQTMVIDDAHARMDLLEQRMKQLRVSDGSAVWDDLEGMPMASLPAKFRMPDIERYTDIGCPRIHLRLYSTVMRAHGLDESQMITLFPLSLSGAA